MAVLATSPGVPIRRIVGMRSQFQVLDVAARRVVTSVPNDETVRDGTVLEFPGDPMCHHASTAIADAPVTADSCTRAAVLEAPAFGFD